MAYNSESLSAECTTADETQLDVSTNDQGRSHDEAATSPTAVSVESCHATSQGADKPSSLRLRMNEKQRDEAAASALPDVIVVRCGDLQGELHVDRLGSGSRGPCVCCNGVWLTPNQFECKGGQGYFRYWKRSIRHETKPLDCYIKQGLIKLHSRGCACNRCCAPITNAPQRLRLNKGKRRKRPRNDKESVEGDNRLGDSDFESKSEAESGNEEGKSCQGNAKKARADMEEKAASTSGKTVDSFVAEDKANSRGKKNIPELVTTGGHLSDDNEKSKKFCKDGAATVVGKRAANEPRRQNGRLGSSQSTESGVLSWKEDVHKDADLSHGRPLPTHSSRSDLADDSTILFGKTPLTQSSLKLVSPRVRQSIDLQLVHSAASALAGVSGSRFLRSQNSASSSQVESMLSVSNPPIGSPSHSSNQELSSPRDGTVRDQVVAAVRRAGVNEDVLSWSVDDVAAFVRSAGFKFQSSLFRQQLINGEALMGLEERHLWENLRMKLGPSLCLFTLIRDLQMGIAYEV